MERREARRDHRQHPAEAAIFLAPGAAGFIIGGFLMD
jgi:hypothetical protein